MHRRAFRVSGARFSDVALAAPRAERITAARQWNVQANTRTRQETPDDADFRTSWLAPRGIFTSRTMMQSFAQNVPHHNYVHFRALAVTAHGTFRHHHCCWRNEECAFNEPSSNECSVRQQPARSCRTTLGFFRRNRAVQENSVRSRLRGRRSPAPDHGSAGGDGRIDGGLARQLSAFRGRRTRAAEPPGRQVRANRCRWPRQGCRATQGAEHRRSSSDGTRVHPATARPCLRCSRIGRVLRPSAFQDRNHGVVLVNIVVNAAVA